MVLPLQDCVLLPVVHTTAEELADYIVQEVIKELGPSLSKRCCEWLEIQVSERPGQAGCSTTYLSAQKEQLTMVSHACREKRIPRPCVMPVSAEPAMPAVEPAEPAEAEPDLGDPEDVGEEAFRRLLSTLGPLESGRPQLLKTPKRAAKAFREMTLGLRVADPLSVAREAIFEVDGAQDLVAVRGIPFFSMCEHHLLPFYGTANIAYFPNGRVLGLSKFARLLEVFARRLQLQERLGLQLCEALVQLLGPKAVAVSLEAYHTCMSHRGASVPSTTRSVCIRGPLEHDPRIRGELLSGVSRSDQAARL